MAFGSKKRTSANGEAELLRGLVNLASEVQRGPELEGIVRAVATTVTQTFGYREAAVYLVDDDGVTFRALATVGEHPDYDAEIFARPVPRRIWDELFLERYQMGSSFFVDHRLHSWTEEQLYYLPPLPLGKRAADEWHEDDDLLVPLYDKRRRLMGVLDLYDPVDKTIPKLEQIQALEVFAAHSAVAIENARQYEELESTSSELERQLRLRHQLLNLSTALLSTLDQGDVFTLISSMLKQIVDYDTMDIRLVDDEAEELVAIYARDENAEEVLSFRSSLDEGVSGWVVRHNEAQFGERHGPRPPGRLHPRYCGGRATGVDHRAAQRARQGHRRAEHRPAARAHLRRAGTRAREALRQHGGDRHPERTQLRGDGAPGDQRRPHRHPQLPPLPRDAQSRPSAAPSATTRPSAC